MAISLYEGRTYDPATFVRVMAVANVVFAALVLFAWPVMGLVLADPIAVATGAGLDAAHAPDYAEFPYVLLWLPPICAVVLAWAAQTAEMNVLARVLVSYPLTLIAISCAWYLVGDTVIAIL